VWRYRVRRKMKQDKFKVADYPTDKALWQRLGTAIRLLNEEPKNHFRSPPRW
jgi:hypothetical protein